MCVCACVCVCVSEREKESAFVNIQVFNSMWNFLIYLISTATTWYIVFREGLQTDDAMKTRTVHRRNNHWREGGGVYIHI